jgi:hypothetical protein
MAGKKQRKVSTFSSDRSGQREKLMQIEAKLEWRGSTSVLTPPSYAYIMHP